jgi:large subunit ribosomal protein L22
MESRAILKNLGMSPKKVRIPAEVVRGMSVAEALSTLEFMQKGAAPHVAKVIKSAASNVLNNGAGDISNLYISEIRVDKGNYRLKNYHPRAKGGGYYMRIRGKSHITVIVSDRPAVLDDKEKATKTNKDVKSSRANSTHTAKDSDINNKADTKAKKIEKKKVTKAKKA